MSVAGTLAAPFPYFGGKSMACSTVWTALGDPPNYVEPFCGSAAVLLGRPKIGKVETINDADGFIANFWRAVANDAAAVARYADWPTNEADLFARHSWLVRHSQDLLDRLHGDPEYYDPKIAGWWCWGECNWIGSGWCDGSGPWIHDGRTIVDSRQLPHLGDAGRGDYIHQWFSLLMSRLRNVRVAVGDWRRVLSESVTTRHGLTGIFLDPPYTRGAMNYAAGGVGGGLAEDVGAWCAENGANPLLRIVLCGHAGEHDRLLQLGWEARGWKSRGGYGTTESARKNTAEETVWCSPHCAKNDQASLFATGGTE